MTSTELKTKDRDLLYVLFAAAIIGSVLFFLDVNNTFRGVRSFLSIVTVPVTAGFHDLNRKIVDVEQSIVSVGTLRSDKRKLEIRVAELEAENATLKLLEKENISLREQLVAFDLRKVKYIPAKVISIDAGALDRSVTIDKGSKDGVSKGDIVVLGSLMFGEVSEVDDYVSYVLLIDSHSSSILGYVQRSGAKGIVSGSNDGLVMDEILVSDDVEVGDIVVTWNERFSVPLVLGEITEVVNTSADPRKIAKLATLIDYSELDTVYVMSEEAVCVAE